MTAILHLDIVVVPQSGQQVRYCCCHCLTVPNEGDKGAVGESEIDFFSNGGGGPRAGR